MILYSCSGHIANIFTKFLPFFFTNGKAARLDSSQSGLGHFGVNDRQTLGCGDQTKIAVSTYEGVEGPDNVQE